MINQNIFHVVVNPPDTLETGLVNQVAVIMGKDPYSIRLALTGKLPKVIAGYQASIEADLVARNLNKLGLVAFVCDDECLRRKPAHVINTTAIKFGEGNAVIFSNLKGENIKVAANEIFLIIKGKRERYIETEDLTTNMKFSVGRTLLTGGIPMWSKKKEKIVNRSLQTGLFLRLYGKVSDEAEVEISQQGMDYSFLGQELSYSSLVNFNTTAEKLKQVFPAAIFDDRLVHVPSSETSPTTSGNNIEVNCKLLYLYYLTLNERPRA